MRSLRPIARNRAERTGTSSSPARRPTLTFARDLPVAGVRARIGYSVVSMSTRLPGPERRAQLLEEALVLFGTKGFHNASMVDIATAAGVTKPVVYQHFSSKEELFAAVLAAAADRLGTVTEKALANATSAREQVEFGLGAILDVCASDPATFRVLFDENARVEPATRQQVVDTQHALASGIANHLDGVGNDDRELQLVLAHAIIGMAESALRYWFDQEASIDAETLRTNLVELAWAGLRGTRPK